MRRALPALALGLLACSSKTPFSMTITTGQETTAFTDDPAVASVEIDVTSPIDSSLKLRTTAKPGDGFDLGNVPGDEYITITVAGFTSDSKQVMSGSSLVGIAVGAVEGDLPVFIQRSGQWARPPGGLACSHVGAVATVKEDRALLLTGGQRAAGDTACDTAAVDAYDVFGLTGLATAPALGPTTPTIVSILPDSNNPNSNPQALLIYGDSASWLDYATGTTTAVSPPNGISFADLAGGAVIGVGGTWFVVGGARLTGAPSQAVLQVDPSGGLGGYALTAPRLGAAAAWVEGEGLVVAGGNSGTNASGVEVLKYDGMTLRTMFTPLPYPADPVVGAAVVTDGATVLLVGGLQGTDPAPTRSIDIGCMSPTCSVIPNPGLNLPVAFASTTAYQLPSQRLLVVGSDTGAMGQTRSYILDLSPGQGSVTEALLREPRRGATPTLTPNGAIALIGGEHLDGSPAYSVEMFLP